MEKLNWPLLLVMVLEFSMVSVVVVGMLLLNILTGFTPFLVGSYFAVFFIYVLGVKRGQSLMAKGIGKHIDTVKKGG